MCLTKLLIEVLCIRIQNENQRQIKKCVKKLEIVYTDLHTHTSPSCITDLFSLVFLLYQRWSTTIRLQDSDSSTCHIMCDVPCIITLCSELTKCFPHMVYKLFFKPIVTIPVASIIADITIHFMFNLHCMTIHKLSYLSIFSPSISMTFHLLHWHIIITNKEEETCL